MEIVTDGKMSKKARAFVNKLNEKADTPKELAYNHLIKADAYRIKNFFWEAIEEYLTALEHDESNFEIYKGLGLAYKQTGFVNSAITAFDDAKKLLPFDKTLYYEAGCCYCIDKKFTGAAKEFKKALKICPDYIEAKLNLAFSYELNNRHAAALEDYLNIIKEHPESSSAYNALGSLYIKLEMYVKAVNIFRDLLKIEKDYSRAYLGIAISYDKLNCIREALRYYKKYIKLKPNCSNLPFINDRIIELKTFIVPDKKSHLRLVS